MPISHGYYETQKEHIIAMSDAAAEKRLVHTILLYDIIGIASKPCKTHHTQ